MTPKQIIEAIKAERPEINTLFFVGCGASSAEQYPAQYFMDCNARKIRTSFYTANEFNYATPVSLDETAIVIACSLGGTTPETVAAAKLSQEKGAKVIAVTHDGNSPLAKNADYVIVHGFEKDYAAKLEKMNNILMLAVEVLNQYEGYDHYEDMVKGSENIYGSNRRCCILFSHTCKSICRSIQGFTCYLCYEFRCNPESCLFFLHLSAYGNAVDQLRFLP